jgi:hypothetical protein
MAVGAYAWGAVADWRGLGFALHATTVWLIATLALRIIAPMPRRDEGRVDPAT